MVLSSDLKTTVITTLKEKIPTLQALYIFGSYANGTAMQKSDIDIAYLSQLKLSVTERWEISQALALRVEKNIDLVELQETNTVFRYQIISTGERIYCSSDEVDAFETLAYSFYLRFQEERQPILDAIYADKKVLHVS